MTVYWDTSGIIRYLTSNRLPEIKGVTRTHTLAELFSTLSGRGIDTIKADGTIRHKRLTMRLAAKVISEIFPRLKFVDLSPGEALAIILEAKAVGAQGARIHDLMHAAAADKANADELWTADENDFAELGRVAVKQL